jgi:hypothetical protein
VRERSLSSGTSARGEEKSARRNGKTNGGTTETDEGTIATTAMTTAGDTTIGICADVSHTWTVHDDCYDIRDDFWGLLGHGSRVEDIRGFDHEIMMTRHDNM